MVIRCNHRNSYILSIYRFDHVRPSAIAQSSKNNWSRGYFYSSLTLENDKLSRDYNRGRNCRKSTFTTKNAERKIVISYEM